MMDPEVPLQLTLLFFLISDHKFLRKDSIYMSVLYLTSKIYRYGLRKEKKEELSSQASGGGGRERERVAR